MGRKRREKKKDRMIKKHKKKGEKIGIEKMKESKAVSRVEEVKATKRH